MPGNTAPGSRRPRSNLDRKRRTARPYFSCVTMGQASIWRTPVNYLERSSAFIPARNSQEPASGWQLCNGSFTGTAGESGQSLWWVREQYSSLPCRLWKVRRRNPSEKKRIPYSSGQRKSFSGDDKMTIQDTLIFSALFALLAAGIYAYIGWRLSKRSEERRV